jgi:hypothetical protein
MSKLIQKISLVNTRHKRAIELFARQHQLSQVRRIQSEPPNRNNPNENTNKEANTKKKSNNLYTALAIGMASGVLLLDLFDTESSKNESNLNKMKFIDMSDLTDFPFFESLKSIVSSSFDKKLFLKPLKAKEAEPVQNEVH